VLTYKTSGIFNFAYGAIAALAVFVFYFLHSQHGMPWPYAAALCIFVLSPIEGLGLELLARILEGATATLKVVATIGLLLIVVGVGTLWYGNADVNFPPFLDTNTIRFLGVNVGWDQITVIIVSLVATALLYYFFRFVRIGVAMRGVVDNPDLVSMTGTNPVAVRRWAWVIGTMFASMAGLLLAPSLSLNAEIIVLLVVQAFGAAAIGYFSSLPLTFVGGLVVGIAGGHRHQVRRRRDLADRALGRPALRDLVHRADRDAAADAGRAARDDHVGVAPKLVRPDRMRLLGRGGRSHRLCFVPSFVGVNLSTWSAALVYVMLFLSLGLLVKTSGQISLCHLAFAAVGAAAFGHLTGSYHVPWLAALALAGLIALPVGALVAIPAIRLSGVFWPWPPTASGSCSSRCSTTPGSCSARPRGASRRRAPTSPSSAGTSTRTRASTTSS
jgi:branched-subunit amino acid ABC-type transport system permease component